MYDSKIFDVLLNILIDENANNVHVKMVDKPYTLKYNRRNLSSHIEKHC